MLRTIPLPEQDEKIFPKRLFIFSLEDTLTKGPINLLQSAEEISDNLKEGIADTFRAIWSAGDVIGISSENLLPQQQLIHEYLIAAELKENEIKKISIKCRGDFLRKFKFELTMDLIESTPDIAEVIYYESNSKELDRAIRAFNDKKLTNGRLAMIKFSGIKIKEGDLQFLNDIKQKYNTPTTQLTHSVLYKPFANTSKQQADAKQSKSRFDFCCCNIL